MEYNMFVLVPVSDIDPLPVIHPDTQHAVIPRALEPAVDQPAKAFAHGSRRIVEKQAKITFVWRPGIKGIVSIEREAILAGLHILKPKGNLRKAGTNAPLFVFRQEQVRIKITERGDLLRPPDQPGKFRLDIDKESFKRLAADDQPRTAEKKLIVPRNGTIRLIASKQIVINRMVITKLRVSTNVDLFIPAFLGRNIAGPTALFQGFGFSFFFFSLNLHPLIRSNQLILQQRIFELTCPRGWYIPTNYADQEADNPYPTDDPVLHYSPFVWRPVREARYEVRITNILRKNPDSVNLHRKAMAQ